MSITAIIVIIIVLLFMFSPGHAPHYEQTFDSGIRYGNNYNSGNSKRNNDGDRNKNKIGLLESLWDKFRNTISSKLASFIDKTWELLKRYISGEYENAMRGLLLLAVASCMGGGPVLAKVIDVACRLTKGALSGNLMDEFANVAKEEFIDENLSSHILGFAESNGLSTDVTSLVSELSVGILSIGTDDDNNDDSDRDKKFNFYTGKFED